MSLADAVQVVGNISPNSALQKDKKRYSERLSAALAFEVADGLRELSFPNVKPQRGGPGEKEFQGGLGPKKVDVSYADERHGLLLAVSIKTICFHPFGKNLKNRFGDLCTEAITLHMRFPYSVVGALFAMPEDANLDISPGRRISTFQRARILLSTISGRAEHASPAEKFENVTMMLFRPLRLPDDTPLVRLFDAASGEEMTEGNYLRSIQSIYNVRNPYAPVGLAGWKAEGEEE